MGRNESTLSQGRGGELGTGRHGGRAVVTGGAGFLGAHLCRHLLNLGLEVVAIDNLATSGMQNLRDLVKRSAFTFLRADVTEPFIIDGPVDYLLHFASPASPADYLRLPIETLDVGSTGTKRALECALIKNARILLASTSEVYGDPLVHPQPEAYWGNVNPVGPRGVYDEAKRFAEALTMAYRNAHGLSTAIARIFNTYGEGMRRNDGRAIPTFIMQALSQQPITVTGDGSQTRSVCYVDDLVAGLVCLLFSELPGPMNMGNPEELSVLELAERVRGLAGSASSIEFIGRPIDDPSVRRPDITAARTELGWNPLVPLNTGLLRTITWFRKDLPQSGGEQDRGPLSEQ